MTINGDNTIGAALGEAANMLSAVKTIYSPRLDSEVLLAYLLNCSRIDLVLKRNEKLTRNTCTQFFKLIERRKKCEPVSYLTHRKEFMSLSFFVQEGVLIPRPETELLVEFIIHTFQNTEDLSVLDLCTGSGAVAVSLAYYLKDVKIVAVDKFDECINTARVNIERHGVGGKVQLVQADVFKTFALAHKFQCIVSNPPYIKRSCLASLPPDVKNYEPSAALDGGDDGLKFYRRITDLAEENLLPGGLLAYEIGCDQGASVKNIIEKSGAFHSVTITKDLAGLDRMVTAFKGE